MIILLSSIVLIISLVANAILVWYIRRVMERSSMIREVTSDMLSTLEDFSTHLGHVYELPLFYGDETIKGLLAHSKEIVTYIKEYKDGFVFEIGGKVDRNKEEEGTPEEE